MEVVLKGVEGAPPNAILSIKCGDVRRQFPISKVGQPFRFSSSPISPLPLKVDIFVPYAQTQEVLVDPTNDNLEVRFAPPGGRPVTASLQHRGAPELRKAGDSITAKLGESESMAANAQYMDKHDLVRTFQDIIHGLLVNKPDNPHEQIQEHLCRAKAYTDKVSDEEAAKRRVRDALHIALMPDEPTYDAATGTGAQCQAVSEPILSGQTTAPDQEPPKRCATINKGTIEGRSKVDTLLQWVKQGRQSVALVLPYLPDDMAAQLQSDDFMSNCVAQFSSLDTEKNGELGAKELLPVIVELCGTAQNTIGMDQASQFAALFDQDNNGRISKDEFTALVQFVCIAHYMDTDEGQAAIAVGESELASWAVADYRADVLTSNPFLDET
jgi:hypothetical protein